MKYFLTLMVTLALVLLIGYGAFVAIGAFHTLLSIIEGGLR